MNPIYKPVQLDVQTHKNLTLLAKRHKRSIKQFTIDMIEFFEKTGIDPTDAKASSLTEAVQNLKSETLKINQLNQEIQTLHDTIKRGFSIVTDNQQGYTNSTKDALNLLMAEIIKINQ